MKFAEFIAEAEAEHPFRYAYPLENANDVKIANQLFDWTVKHYGHSAPRPQFWVVSNEHMQDAVHRANHFTKVNGVVYGWFSHAYPTRIFMNSSLHPSRNRHHAAILVHEIAHYLQYHTERHSDKKPFGPEHVQFLEDEADQIMMDFFKGR